RLAAWQAGKAGVAGELVDPLTSRPRPARDVVDALREHVSEALCDTDDWSLVDDGLRRILAVGTGATHQRSVLEQTGDLGAVVSDAGLAILAADPARYADYAAGVRRDYASVPDADFRAGRRAVLEELLSRDALFRTSYAREHWEPRARENLAREIADL